MQIIPSFADARVLVVGDVMLDRYWHGDTGRISPEAPVPVVRVGREEMRLGGAGNVALNLAALGVQTTLIGVVGEDAAGTAVQQLLADAGVSARLVHSKTHPSIAKLRVISRNQQLIRLDFEKLLDAEDAFDHAQLSAACADELPSTDVVVCSDYGKGTLHRVSELITQARAAQVPVLVDPKGTDWQRYAGATLLTPNLPEFAAIAGPVMSDDALEQSANALRNKLDVDALLVTRSERGMSLFAGGLPLHLPAQAQEVFDVTGAGDTVIALLAAGMATGSDMQRAADLANVGAGVVVSKVGTASVSVVELRRAMRNRHADDAGVLDDQALLWHVEEAHAHGEKVVMTNGCFDLLHPGHIRYLQAARQLGDWLVVAVNDDASVARLKGDQRPLNPVDQRMEVLAALDAVDWVVPFAQDTPRDLICRIKPDVLVKGGDYRVEDVAGGECVQAAGGEVRILEFVDGYSTSAMLARMRRD